jgi:hypothetical protein
MIRWAFSYQICQVPMEKLIIALSVFEECDPVGFWIGAQSGAHKAVYGA